MVTLLVMLRAYSNGRPDWDQPADIAAYEASFELAAFMIGIVFIGCFM